MKKFNKSLLAGTIGVISAFLMSTSVFAAVSVKVTGDTDHAPKQHTAYETWIDTSYDYSDGLTAKDAVLNTLTNSGFTYVYFDESNYLASVTSDKGVTLPGQSDTGYGGWMYNVNGISPSVGLADYVLNDNDAVEIYYVDDYRDIYGYGVNINVSPADAEVRIFDKDKNEMVDYGWGYSLLPGDYTYVVRKLGYKTVEGSLTIKDDDGIINDNLQKKENVAVVRIVGDEPHESGKHELYDEWAASEETVDGSVTAEELIKKTLGYIGAEAVMGEAYGSTYIAGVKTYSGDVLSEFTNGDKSGWIYTVNGTAPYVGVGEYTVQPGDEVIFHYYDDYREFYGYTVNINTDYPAVVAVIDLERNGNIDENSWGGYSLPAGKYRYVVTKEGFDGASDDFEITNDDLNIDVTLTPAVPWGDYDLSGTLEAADATNILQKALVSTFASPLVYDFTIIDINQNGSVDAEDSAYVMQKVLLSTFKLPCEK